MANFYLCLFFLMTNHYLTKIFEIMPLHKCYCYKADIQTIEGMCTLFFPIPGIIEQFCHYIIFRAKFLIYSNLIKERYDRNEGFLHIYLKKTLKYSDECIWLINQIMLNFSGLYMFMYRLITDNKKFFYHSNYLETYISLHNC